MKQPSRSAEEHATPGAPSGAWTRRRLLQLGSVVGAGATFGRALVAPDVGQLAGIRRATISIVVPLPGFEHRDEVIGAA